eukprot:COSAG02_NODE_48550_length_333_cov_0.602564_1_plen_39_part_01
MNSLSVAARAPGGGARKASGDSADAEIQVNRIPLDDQST